MSEHLSNTEIQNYLKRQMPPAELLRADDHLAECLECFSKVKNLKTGVSAAAFDFLYLAPVAPSHLNYDQLENFVDEKSDAVDREIADAHLKVCGDCRSEMNGLIEMRNLIEADLQKQAVVPEQSAEKSVSAKVQNFFFGNLFFKFGLAGIVLLFLISAMFLLSKRNSNLPDTAETAKTSAPPFEVNSPLESRTTTPANAVMQVSNVATPNSSTNSQNQAPAEDKKNELPSPYRTEIERVLAANRLNLPAELNQLGGGSGRLMGGGNESVPFALEFPLGKIIQTARPQFRWKPLEGASGYVVEIYDTNFNRVAGSSQISGTSWQIDGPLPGNKIYVWQVTAIKDGQQIKSPVRPAPDAKFKIINAAKADELTRLSRQYKNEHLALGILYANAGLLDEAEREFQKEINKNPNSKTARRFLQEVRKLK